MKTLPAAGFTLSNSIQTCNNTHLAKYKNTSRSTRSYLCQHGSMRSYFFVHGAHVKEMETQELWWRQSLCIKSVTSA